MSVGPFALLSGFGPQVAPRVSRDCIARPGRDGSEPETCHVPPSVGTWRRRRELESAGDSLLAQAGLTRWGKAHDVVDDRPPLFTQQREFDPAYSPRAGATGTCFVCMSPGGIERRSHAMHRSWYDVAADPSRTVYLCSSCYQPDRDAGKRAVAIVPDDPGMREFLSGIGWSGFSVQKLGTNGRPVGSPLRGNTSVPDVLAKIQPPPRYSENELRAVAKLRGPAVNGDGPKRDELDRLASEFRHLGGNVAAFALYYGCERKHVYTRIERHRQRVESRTEVA